MENFMVNNNSLINMYLYDVNKLISNPVDKEYTICNTSCIHVQILPGLQPMLG